MNTITNNVSVHAPAKINTILRVLDRRPDGYHDLAMVMEKLDLADELELTTTDGAIELAVDGQSDEGMEQEKNLAWRAAAAFKEATGEGRGVSIRLTKRIPVAAGLGGGSSDAAATLVGLNRLWDKGLSNEQLAKLGEKLGADVPFFCYDGPALVEGTGHRVLPLEKKLPKLYVLLINPGFAVSTPWVYQQWDALNPSNGPALSEQSEKPRVEGLTVKGADASVPRLFEVFRDVTANLANDLEAVTVSEYPEVGEIKEYLSSAGAEGVLMAGSGPTVFGLFSDAKSRDGAASQVTKETWKVIATEN